MDSYIKIKEFAELTGLSVRALQYYDEIDLLKPAYVNEYGHRLYDSDSFSKIFIIISLKNMGMNLRVIHEYLNNNNFDIRIFIEEEKRRVERSIIDLQLRLMRLSRLGEQVEEKKNITPDIIPLLSQIMNNTAISQEQMDSLIKSGNKKYTFNLKGWNLFIKDLNFCFENKLSAKDKRAIKCIEYWKENVLEANQLADGMVKIAEEFYQDNPENTFGITGDTYKYLTELIGEYNRINQ